MPAISIDSNNDEWGLVISQTTSSVFIVRYELPQQIFVFLISQPIKGFALRDPFVMRDLMVRLEFTFSRGLHVPVENHLRLALRIVGGKAREARDHGVVTSFFLDFALRGQVPALALFDVALGQSPVLIFRSQDQQNLAPAQSLTPDDAARGVNDFPTVHSISL